MCEGQYGKLSFNLTFTFKINFRCDLVFKVRQKKIGLLWYYFNTNCQILYGAHERKHW